jgi:plastocyanin
MKHPAAVALPILAAAALAGCGSSSKTASTPPAAPPAGPSSSSTPAASAPATGGLTVTMQNLAYAPSTINAKVGQTITFVNRDTPPHNVTHVSGPSFTASPTLSTGASFKLKLTKAGTISYFCSIHPFMKGTIVVA